MSLHIDREAFYRRIKRFYSSWKKEGTVFSSIDSVLVSVGQNEEDQYSKSIALHIWLFGYEMTDTIIAFCKEKIIIMTSKKKAEFLRPITTGKGSENSEGVPAILIIQRSKEDNTEGFSKLHLHIKVSGTGKNVGQFTKDNFEGKFYKEFKKDLKTRSYDNKDVSADIGLLLAVKEDNEISATKKASMLTMEIYSKIFKQNLMGIIDADKKVKHTKVTNQIEDALKDKSKLLGVDPANVESCYPPIIQSGGKYSFKYSAQSTKDPLHFGTIVAMIGLRYKNYCSNTVRTLFVNPIEEQQSVYTTILEAHEKAIEEFRAGIRLSKIFETVQSHLKSSKYPHLAEKIGKNLGFGMGIDFRESALVINAKNSTIVKKGMVFNLNIGISGIKNKEAKDEKSAEYGVCIGDTIMIRDNEAAKILTEGKKKSKNVSIFLKDESSDDDAEITAAIPDTDEFRGRGMRNSSLTMAKRDHENNEEKRKKNQVKLADQLNEEAKERLLNKDKGEDKVKQRKSNISYKNSASFPQESDIRNLKIFIDKKYETIILPIYGVPTPFHISTIKNCSSSVEGDYTYLRLNFFVPGAMMGKLVDGPYPQSALGGPFLKEVTFRAPGQSQSTNNLNMAYRMLKEVQKKFKTREAEQRELAGVIKQDKLQLNLNRANPKIRDLIIRPHLTQKRMQGYLEAHVNGFRYTTQRGDKVDILYKNLKHAIFQPSDKEMIMVLHFHLKNGIMIGKKRHVDVQFYIEVGEITTDLGKTGNMRDRDDLYAEEQEREQRKKLKQAFRTFIDKVHSLQREIDFDEPFRDLGFHGVPHRSTCLLQPTSTALMNVTEWPPFVVTLDAIEFIHFERVQFSLKNFDLVIIYKDYAKKVSTITSIPMQSLDSIKDWLNSCDIRYTEGIQSLNWGKILKTVTEDPVGFFEQGGWDFLKDDSGDEMDDDDEDDDDFKEESEGGGGDGDGSGGDDDDDDSEENYTSEEEEESGSSEELGSSEESGKDWDELEDEARRDDKTFEDDDRAPRDKHRGDKHRSGGGSSSQKRKSSHSSSKGHSSSMHKSKKQRRR